MSRRSLKETLSKHFEKFLVASVIAVIAAYGINLAAGTSEASQLSTQARAAVERVREAERQAAIPPEAQNDFLPRLERAFLDMPAAGVEPSWFAFKRPYALRRAEFVSQPKPLHLPPLLEAKADVGQVELRWRDSDNNENVVITGYELHRNNPSGKWEKVAEFGPKENACTDKGLEHEESYAYKLVSISQPALGAAQFDNPQDAKKECEPQTVRTRFNFDVKISSWAPGHASGKIAVFKPGGGEDKQPFSWHVGSHVVINGKDTGWVVEKIEESSITIKKGDRRKPFGK